MGKTALKAYKSISRLSVPPHIKFKIVQTIRNTTNRLRHNEEVPACLIMSNEGYGHEYWLKEYSGYEGDIYAQIEHGVYFGKNISSQVNVISEEHQIGSIITYGDYRKECIREAYPNYNVQMIGPYIQYVAEDKKYKEEIKRQINPNYATLVLFPAHSVASGHILFSHYDLIEDCKKYAYERDFKNLMVCLSPMDINSQLAAQYEHAGFLVVTSGDNRAKFLSRQKAIFNIADLSVSNAMGTHIGYSIACNTPHRLVRPIAVEDRIKGNCIAPGVNLDALKQEHGEFISSFYIEDSGKDITASQYDLFNYFWGGKIKLNPQEIRKMLFSCKQYYLEQIKPYI